MRKRHVQMIAVRIRDMMKLCRYPLIPVSVDRMYGGAYCYLIEQQYGKLLGIIRTMGFLARVASYTMKAISPRSPRIRGTRTRAESHGNSIPLHVKAITHELVDEITRKFPLRGCKLIK